MCNLRSEIKHNFLKQLIFRLDYEGILEADVEKCVFELRQKMYDAGFINMDTRTENQFDVQLKMDLNIPDQNQFSISNTNKSLVYTFTTGSREILEISKSFFSLTVDVDAGYGTFDKYVELLADSIYVIKNVSPYFRAHRIGLRKINICFLNKLDDLPTYFTKAAFNLTDVIEQFSEYGCSASNMVTLLSRDGYRVNYVRNIQEGVMQQEDGSQSTTYQIALDVDVYKESNKEILSALEEKELIKQELKKQNSIEFEVFIRSLSDRLVEMLKQDTFDDSAINGVI